MWTTATGSFLSIIVLLGAVDPPLDAPPDPAPLSGPTVKAGDAVSADATLVHRAFDGKVQRLETELERAAIALIELTAEQQKELDRILLERRTIFDRTIRENYDLLIELGSINQNDQPAEFLKALVRLGQAMGDYRRRGTLVFEMAPHLTTEQFRHVTRLVDEYIQARVDEAQTQGEKVGKFAMAIRVRFESMGVMAQQSIQSAAGMALEMFDDFAQRLKLTAVQQEKIKAVTGPIFVQELQGKTISAVERIKVFTQIANLLDPEQRRLFVEYGRELKQSKPESDSTDDKPGR